MTSQYTKRHFYAKLPPPPDPTEYDLFTVILQFDTHRARERFLRHRKRAERITYAEAKPHMTEKNRRDSFSWRY